MGIALGGFPKCPLPSPALRGVYPILATPFRRDGASTRPTSAASSTSSSRRAPTASCFRAWRASSRRSRADERRTLVDVVARARRRAHAARRRRVRGRAARRPRRSRSMRATVGAAAVMAVAPAVAQGQCAGASPTTTAHRARSACRSSCRTRRRPRAARSRPSEVARDRARRSRHPLREGRDAALRPAHHAAPRGAACRRSPASSAARAGATSPTSSRAAPAARCPRASSPTCTSRQFALHRAGDAAGVRRLFDRMLPLLNFQAVFRMAMTKEVLRRRGVITATHVRAAGPKLDAGDLRELDGDLLGHRPRPDCSARPACSTRAQPICHHRPPHCDLRAGDSPVIAPQEEP